MLTFNSSDGVDASYRSTFGKTISTLRAHFGYQSLRSDIFDGELEIWGINDTVEIGSLVLRAAYINAHLTGLGDGLSPLLDPFVAATAGLPNGISQDAARAAERLRRTYDITLPQEAHLVNIGATYDPGQWFATAEFFDQRSDTAVGKSMAGYVSAGYRWNSWTPYATLARTANHVRNDPGIPVAGLPAPLAGFSATINGVVLGLLNVERSQTTLSLGVRWDVAPKLALKSQFDHVDLGSNSAGLLQNVQPGFEAGGSVNLFSIAVDYVF